VQLGGIFQNRFPKSMQEAKQAIVDGWLGDIVYASGSCLWYRAQSYYDSGAWRGTWALDGGTLANQGIHYIDRLVWLAGMQPEVVSAYCPTLKRDMEAEDLGVALLKFPNGAGGVFEGTTLANPGLQENVTICGTKGSLVTQGNVVTYFKAEGAPEGLVTVTDPNAGGGAGDPSGAWGEAHKLNIRDFAASIIEGREPWVTASEGRKAVQLLNDIYRAAKVGPWAEPGCCCGG
jgi:predicted dehydrogenase